MSSEIRRCAGCGIYTLQPVCPKCSSDTVCTIPMKYSPEDRYGEYRRRSNLQEYGENGKYRPL